MFFCTSWLSAKTSQNYCFLSRFIRISHWRFATQKKQENFNGPPRKKQWILWFYVIECNVEYEDYTIFVHELSIKQARAYEDLRERAMSWSERQSYKMGVCVCDKSVLIFRPVFFMRKNGQKRHFWLLFCFIMLFLHKWWHCNIVMVLNNIELYLSMYS